MCCLYERLFLFRVVGYWKLSDINIGIVLLGIFFRLINVIFERIGVCCRSSWIKGIVFGLFGIKY